MLRSIFAARFFLVLLLGAGSGAAAATTASAVEAPPGVALVSAGHTQLEWSPLGDFESITLALSDPQGLVRTHRFGPGEAPVLSLFDAQGMPLPDGTYTWELRAPPRRSAGRPATLLVQSGYFTISNGGLIAPDLNEPPEKIMTSEDQIVPDDLIVDGKGCIGLGCANNEAFFAEALRLKQSVVRLRFEDTSTTAGLPARDWQLTVNDSASGGADRFSIDDLTAGTTPFTVRGGAPSNSLYVDGVGNIGLGTATPANKLHVSRSSGNPLNVAVALIEDASGTTAFRTMLELRNYGASRFNLTDTFAGTTWGTNNNNGTLNMIKSGTGGILAFSLQGTGNLTIAGTLTQNSDRTTKTDIQPVDSRRVLAKIAELPISTWRKVGDTSAHLGPMAQDFRAAFGLGENDRHIALIDLAGVGLAAVQGLNTLVEEQRQTIERQQELIGQLEERLLRLEAQRSTED